MLCRSTMACCGKSIYQEPRKLRPETRLFGASWWKVIKAFWVYEIVQVSLVLLTGGAKIKNAQGSDKD